MSRVAFLVGGDKAAAIRWAEAQGWPRLAAFRFTNDAREDVRVIDAVADFACFGAGTRVYRADGFETRPDQARWGELVALGKASWG